MSSILYRNSDTLYSYKNTRHTPTNNKYAGHLLVTVWRGVTGIPRPSHLLHTDKKIAVDFWDSDSRKRLLYLDKPQSENYRLVTQYRHLLACAVYLSLPRAKKKHTVSEAVDDTESTDLTRQWRNPSTTTASNVRHFTAIVERRPISVSSVCIETHPHKISAPTPYRICVHLQLTQHRTCVHPHRTKYQYTNTAQNISTIAQQRICTSHYRNMYTRTTKCTHPHYTGCTICTIQNAPINQHKTYITGTSRMIHKNYIVQLHINSLRWKETKLPVHSRSHSNRQLTHSQHVDRVAVDSLLSTTRPNHRRHLSTTRPNHRRHLSTDRNCQHQKSVELVLARSQHMDRHLCPVRMVHQQTYLCSSNLFYYQDQDEILHLTAMKDQQHQTGQISLTAWKVYQRLQNIPIEM